MKFLLITSYHSVTLELTKISQMKCKKEKMYGSESFHNTVRFLLVNYIKKNAKDFEKYLSTETMEMHLKRLK